MAKGKLIPNFPGYFATKDGRIWSENRYKKGKFLKPGLNCGRLTVSLGRNNSKLVHRLILETFIGPCPAGMETCHYDDNSLNNNLSNLRWDTPINNAKDKKRNGNVLRGEQNGASKLIEQEVRMIIYMWKTKEFSQQEMAKIYNVSRRNVRCIISKKTWKHIWRN